MCLSAGLYSEHNKASTIAMWVFHGRAFFVFKLYDPSLNLAKKGRVAMKIKIKETPRGRGPSLKDLSNKVSRAEQNVTLIT